MRRRLSLLGGTTSGSDCMVALGYLMTPRRAVEGPAIARYERAFAERVGVGYGVSFATGRLALFQLLRAHGIGHGDEVLLQVPTHVVVPNVVRAAGARPVFVDCRPQDWNMDLEDAARRAGPRARALVLQHTFGLPADVEGARELCRTRNLLLVEDCVHALGATWRGTPVGGLGDCAFFSTEETKTISTTMGGMAVTDDAEIARRLREYQEACSPPPRWLTARYLLKLIAYHVLTEPRVHTLARALYDALGQRSPLPRPTEEDELAGGIRADFEQRLANAQAALGLRQLGRLDANVTHRRAIARAYAERLTNLGFPAPAAHPAAQPSPVRHALEVVDRPGAVRRLSPHTVVGTWFTSVLEEAVTPEAGGYEPGSCPVAEAAAQHLINLPTHHRVRLQDVDVLTRELAGLVPNGTRGSSGP